MVKRVFDIVVAVLSLLLLSPLLAIVALLIVATSGFPVFYSQERIGRNFRPFRLHKFRTMRTTERGSEITVADDPRITTIGSWLRKTKIDELPQLFNVIKGDMSLVGPRPEVPRYVEQFRTEFESVLRVRPGITGAASVRFRNESDLLASVDDPEELYVGEILPEKLKIEAAYVKNRSLSGDIRILGDTFTSLFRT